MIGSIVSRRLATLHELQTIYSLEDAFNLYEIILIDSNNLAAEEEVLRRNAGKHY